MSITLDGTNGITSPGIIGVTDGSNATAGTVGEYISSTVNAPSSGLTNSTTATITSISLTAGDWDVSGVFSFNFGTGASATQAYGALSTGTTLPSSSNGGSIFIPATLATSSGLALTANPIRVNVTTTTTVYLLGYLIFVGGSAGAGGYIRARRVR